MEGSVVFSEELEDPGKKEKIPDREDLS